MESNKGPNITWRALQLSKDRIISLSPKTPQNNIQPSTKKLILTKGQLEMKLLDCLSTTVRTSKAAVKHLKEISQFSCKTTSLMNMIEILCHTPANNKAVYQIGHPT